MDQIIIQNDGQFDSGVQPVTTSGTMQEVCRIAAHGHKCLLSITIAGGTIADIQILQSAFADDPHPQVLADGNGFNSPALANESYILPPLTLPFGPGTFQVHVQGDAYELIVNAQGASTGGVTARVQGFLRKPTN
jgi:hypothetical protein